MTGARAPGAVAGPTWLWWPTPDGARRAATGVLTLPFDAARAQYGAAVECGLVQRSMLAGATFERALRAWERFTLGAMAREV